MAVRADVRPEIQALAQMGRMPSAGSGMQAIREWEDRLMSIQPPITEAEAQALLELFPVTHCHGVEWQLINLIETLAPAALDTVLSETTESNEWIDTLKMRLNNWKRSRASTAPLQPR